MKRCFVTGGTGFVGANLVRKLLRDGHRVELLVRPESNRWRLNEVEKDLVFHEIQPGNAPALEKALRSSRPQWIFNLAAHGAYSWQNDAAAIIEANFTGVVHLLEAALPGGFEAFIQAGSSSEYGWKDHPPKEEEAAEPNSVYAAAKNAATQYCRWMGKSKNLPLCILRLYSVYGPYEDPRRLIPRLVLEGLKKKLPPLARPDIARDFIHADDVVRALIRAAEFAARFPGEIFNVGSGVQTTLAQAVETARTCLAIEAQPVWESMPDRSWDTTCWVACIAKVQGALDWNPSFSFPQGFRQTMEWFAHHGSEQAGIQKL
jgi:nucleoside-diphosphate-sugar epimerase